MREKRTAYIQMKVLPSVKAMAVETAEKDGRTMSNYIENLIREDYERRKETMEKYYYHDYDRRMGGDYCEIYDADLKKVRTVKGASEVDGLQEITKRKTTVSALQKVEPLNDEFGLVVGRHEMSREQIDNINKNLGIK